MSAPESLGYSRRSRRDFLKTSTTAAGAAMQSNCVIAHARHYEVRLNSG